MDKQLKEIFITSKKAISFTYLSVYLVIIIGLVFAIVGALNNSSFTDKPYYIIAIIFLILGIINNFLVTYLFVKKTKKQINNLPSLRQDFNNLYKNVYIYPLYCWNQIIRGVNLILAASNDEDFLKQEFDNVDQSKILFETERLNIRHFENSDLDFVYAYRNNNDINYFQTYDSFTKEEIKKMFENNQNTNLYSDPAIFAISLKEKNQIVGELFVSYKNKSNEYFIGFTISPEFQRNGYAYEAVSELMVKVATEIKKIKFICTVYEKNIKSINLIKKLEFSEVSSFCGEKGKILIFEKKYN